MGGRAHAQAEHTLSASVRPSCCAPRFRAHGPATPSLRGVATHSEREERMPSQSLIKMPGLYGLDLNFTRSERRGSEASGGEPDWLRLLGPASWLFEPDEAIVYGLWVGARHVSVLFFCRARCARACVC